MRDLQEFHRLGLLVPLYRVDDEPVPELKMELLPPIGNDPGFSALLAARDGRLHDPALEDYSDDLPYELPEGKSPREWWNGYLYSSWQLLDLHYVVNDRNAIAHGFQQDLRAQRAERIRDVVHALVALSPLYMPSVIGQMSMPPGMEEDEYLSFRRSAGAGELLTAAGFSPADLRKEAEWLLRSARSRDPLADWLPLIRHSSYAGWFKLKWQALDCIWARIGAEILLRAHESLAEAGAVEPLPSLEGVIWRSSLK